MQLESKLGNKGNAVIEQELVHSRHYLTATKDSKWKRMLIKRIAVLEKEKKSAVDTKELEARYKAFSDVYEKIKSHPDYTKTRKKRTPK